MSINSRSHVPNQEALASKTDDARALLRESLNALELSWVGGLLESMYEDLHKRITAHLATPAPEPVLVAYGRDLDGTGSIHICAKDDEGAIALYTLPQEEK